MSKALPEDGQPDLKAWGIILIVDDLGEDHWGDKIGQGDHNGRQVQDQEILPNNHLVNFL